MTPDDVENAFFTQTAFRRGYDVEEVDTFLDEVKVALELKDETITYLSDRVDDLEWLLGKGNDAGD